MVLRSRLTIRLVSALLILLTVATGVWLWNRQSSDLRRPAGGLECGQWAVYRACELMGVHVSPRALREMMPSGPRGHSLKEIADTLKRAGLTTRGRKETFDTFLNSDGIRIVHIASPEHFIVVVRTGVHRVFFLDDRGRRQTIPTSVLRGRWSGHVLYVERPSLESPVGFGPGEVSQGEPRVQFDTLFVDKGDVPMSVANKTITFEFPFRNFGHSELVIKKVHTNCSCLAAGKPTLPTKPGATDVITLQYSLEKGKQEFLHEAVVETNDPAFPVLVLRAAGNTNARVTVTPASLDFGSIPFGQPRTAVLFLRYGGEEDFAVEGASSTLPDLTLAVHEKVTKELADRLWPRSHDRAQLAKSARVLEISTSPSTGILEVLKGEIIITTNIVGFEKIAIPVSGRVVPPVAAFPTLLSFGEVEPTVNLERSVLLASSVEKPFRVLAVKPGVPGLSWSSDSTPTGSKQARLRFSATGAAALKLSGTSLNLRVESDGKEFDLQVPVHASKKASP